MGDAPITTFQLSIDGEQDVVGQIKQQLGLLQLNSGIKSITVTIESYGPVELKPQQPEEEPVDPPTSSESEPESEHEPEPEVDTADEGGDLVKFNEDSDALRIAELLHERRDEGFLELREIQQFTPNEYGIADGRFSGILWDLSNRGLVEKKDHPSDGRKNVYKLTNKGEASVERMQ